MTANQFANTPEPTSNLPVDEVPILAAPLFGLGDESDDADGNPLSLRSFIKKRLQQQHLTEAVPVQPNPVPVVTAVTSGTTATSGGNRLNAIDTQWQAGIEQYLPTPIFRFRLTKARLDKELAILITELEQYRALTHPSPQTQHKISQLSERVQTVSLHLEQVTRQLETLTLARSPWAAYLQRFSFWKDMVRQVKASIMSMITLEQILNQVNPNRAAMSQLNQELYTLNQVFTNGIQNPAIPYSEISDIVTQYEQSVAQIDALKAQLQKPLISQWWTQITHFATGKAL